ncbi:hypothetical protein DM992_40515 (plasmid) [Burkholderia sp. JP2-270]|nr:hypothetical protein DM992_40515 [Burkholderia sp. JP2-270]
MPCCLDGNNPGRTAGEMQCQRQKVIPQETGVIRSRIFSLREFYRMKKSRFTDSQIMDALKRVEAGLAVPDLCRELGISTATFYKWRSKYGGMDVSLIARMKELEAENARLRKMYVEEKLKAEIVAEALAKKD